jgi:neutral amino acid transport system permease protein
VDFVAILASGLREAFGPTAAWFALMAIGLNIHYGYTGLLNFGQIGFALVGAYGTGIGAVTFGWPLFPSVLFGLFLAVVLALILGIPTLRLRGDYFAITTIAAAEVLRLVARSHSMTDLTGGPFGLQAVASSFYQYSPVTSGVRFFSVWGYRADQIWSIGVTWLLVIAGTLLVLLLMRSPWGRAIKAIREDEDAARALGKNAFVLKLQALVLGGLFGALGGVMLTIQTSSVNDVSFMPRQTFFAYAILIIGGAATRLGPVVGSMLFWFLFAASTSFLRQLDRLDILPAFLSGTARIGAFVFIAVGVVLMVMIVYRPQGLLGNRRELILDR